MNMNHLKSHSDIADILNLQRKIHAAESVFRGILVITVLLLIAIGVFDFYADKSIQSLKERFIAVEGQRNEIFRYDEILTMSARMAAATGDEQWEKKYTETEPKLIAAIERAVVSFPQIYRREIGRNNYGLNNLLDMEHQAFAMIRRGQGKEAMDMLFGKAYEEQKQTYVQTIERLNSFLIKQMESALEVEKSKENLARLSFIAVLILLLMSWLILLRIARKSHDALLKSNQELDQKVKERTSSLKTALDDLQKAHDELKNIQNQLLQSEKFTAIGQLAAGIAHEINNPIGFINSNLQTMSKYADHYKKLYDVLTKLELAILEKDTKTVAALMKEWSTMRGVTNYNFIGEDVNALIAESVDGADKIRCIVADLCTFAKPDNESMHDVNIEALIESVLNISWNEIKYKAELVKDYNKVPHVLCNPQKIAQVFVNLLINAAHAIHEKGVIIIKTFFKDNKVCVAITDTGVGIAPEFRNQIFDPFFTTKSPGQGTGLGLSVSYDIIRKHGGNISFNSQLGKGTTFTVELPIDQKKQEPSELRESA